MTKISKINKSAKVVGLEALSTYKIVFLSTVECKKKGKRGKPERKINSPFLSIYPHFYFAPTSPFVYSVLPLYFEVRK